jgi:small nuclear ribonucleoprotein (snRNP)-like protein
MSAGLPAVYPRVRLTACLAVWLSDWLSIQLSGCLQVTGTLKGYDDYVNMVLEDVTEM